MQYRTLGKTGLTVSCIGFGASPLGDVFHVVDPAESSRTVHAAIAAGINFFDVSPYYGQTLAEQRLGEALGQKRQSIVLATKCGRDGVNSFDFSRARIFASVDESLRRLQTDYVDILQAHDIEFADRTQIAEVTLPALLEVKSQGKARFIGITGYQLRMLASFLDSSPLDVVLTYCRSNLLVNDMDKLLLPVVQRTGVGLINASPLHMGLLTPAEPPAWHPAPAAVKQVARSIVSLCQQHGVSSSQVALRYCLDHPHVATTLVGMASVQQVEANLQTLEMQIDPVLLSQIQELVSPVKDAVWPSGLSQNADYADVQQGRG